MSNIKTPNHWKPGSKLQVTSVLSEGIARRFMGYCAEEERNFAGAIRLAVKRLLEEAGH
jgi:hypothetical protein